MIVVEALSHSSGIEMNRVRCAHYIWTERWKEEPTDSGRLSRAHSVSRGRHSAGAGRSDNHILPDTGMGLALYEHTGIL